MRIGIMQPYFFPYLGYYSAIKHTDHWIVFDPVQYDRKGWIHRNRILKPEGSSENIQYFSVPVIKAPLETLISDMQVDWARNWPDKIFQQLEHYKKKAPFYSEVVDFLRHCFAMKESSITHLNAKYLEASCQYIGIPFEYEIFSECDIKIDPPSHPGQWALNICKVIEGVSTYINLPGGKGIFVQEEWDAIGVELKFLSNQLTPYDQTREMFEAGLSIIDVMMFNSPSDIQILLDDIIIEGK